MEDELKHFVDASKALERHGSKKGLIVFLAKHGDTLLAAVRLAESCGPAEEVEPMGCYWPRCEPAALDAYRAAKEASDAE